MFADSPRVSRHFEDEYYREPGLTDDQLEALLLPDTILPADLTPEEEREACRALKGSILRQEVFALDRPPRSEQPYSVSERNYDLVKLQPPVGNHHPVFFPYPPTPVNSTHYRTLHAS